MAPAPSKAAKTKRKQPQDLLDFSTQKVRPALDELLAILRAFGESLEECREAFLQVGLVIDHVVRRSGDALSRCCPFSFQRFLHFTNRPLQGNLPVMFVLQIVVMLYNAFVFCYMPAVGLAWNSPTSLIFHAFIVLVLSSMAQAVWTDPGSVPQTSKWRSFGQPPEDIKECKKSTGEARWCQNSSTYKPDRAHYCRASGRVVLRMDHFCPWIGNTVGFANHKYFFLFLLYTNLMCGFLGVSFLHLLVHATLPAISQFLLIGAEGLTLLLSSILLPFFLFHCNLLSRNMTTIEFCGQTEEGDSPYDLGTFRNLCSVLGDNPLLWFVPLSGPTGDGLSFARRSTKSAEGDSHESRDDSREKDLEANESANSEVPDKAIPTSASKVGGESQAARASAGESYWRRLSSAIGLEAAVDAGASNAAGSGCNVEDSPPTSVFVDNVTTTLRFVTDLPDDFKVGLDTIGEGTKVGFQAIGKGTQALGDMAHGMVSHFSSMCTESKKRPRKSKRKSRRSSSKTHEALLPDMATSDTGTHPSSTEMPTSSWNMPARGQAQPAPLTSRGTTRPLTQHATSNIGTDACDKPSPAPECKRLSQTSTTTGASSRAVSESAVSESDCGH